MTWISTPPRHKCSPPPVEGRHEGDWWICPECDRGWPVHEFDGSTFYGLSADRPIWMHATRELRPKKWWGR